MISYSFFQKHCLPTFTCTCLHIHVCEWHEHKWWGLDNLFIVSFIFWVKNRQSNAWGNWQIISKKSVYTRKVYTIYVLLIYTHHRQAYPSSVYTQDAALDIVNYSLLSTWLFHSHILYIVYPLSIGISFEYTHTWQK